MLEISLLNSGLPKDSVYPSLSLLSFSPESFSRPKISSTLKDSQSEEHSKY